MIRNYLTIAFRNLTRHKLHSVINIGGLGVGLACVVLGILFARDELSYDAWVPNSQNVYRVETTAKWNLHPNGPANVPLGPAVGIVDPAHKDGPLTPEIAAEIERQKAATQALLQQGSRLNQTLGQLSQSVAATKQISEDNARLKSALSLTEQRLETLEEQFRQKQTETTFTTPSTPQLQGTNDW